MLLACALHVTPPRLAGSSGSDKRAAYSQSVRCAHAHAATKPPTAVILKRGRLANTRVRDQPHSREQFTSVLTHGFQNFTNPVWVRFAKQTWAKVVTGSLLKIKLKTEKSIFGSIIASFGNRIPFVVESCETSAEGRTSNSWPGQGVRATCPAP